MEQNPRYQNARPIIGSLWITLYGAGAFSYIWYTMQEPVSLVPIYLIPVVLWGVGLLYLRPVLRLGRGGGSRRPTFSRRRAIELGAIFASYSLSIFIADSILFQLNESSLIAPVDILIVGLHFFPLGRFFNIWQYYVTGTATVAVVIATMLAASSTVMVEGLSAWTVIPFLGDAAALWLTSALMLIWGVRSLRLAQRFP
jgi:hypothetical protein